MGFWKQGKFSRRNWRCHCLLVPQKSWSSCPTFKSPRLQVCPIWSQMMRSITISLFSRNDPTHSLSIQFLIGFLWFAYLFFLMKYTMDCQKKNKRSICWMLWCPVAWVSRMMSEYLVGLFWLVTDPNPGTRKEVRRCSRVAAVQVTKGNVGWGQWQEEEGGAERGRIPMTTRVRNHAGVSCCCCYCRVTNVSLPGRVFGTAVCHGKEKREKQKREKSRGRKI